MQFLFQFSLSHTNRRIAIWCCWLQNCYKVLSKSTIFSIFFSPLNPCQSLQIGCSWSQKVSVSRRRVTTKICNTLSHYFLQISLKIRRKKHCETNFLFFLTSSQWPAGGRWRVWREMETNKTFWSPLQPTDGQENPTDEWTCLFFSYESPQNIFTKTNNCSITTLTSRWSREPKWWIKPPF